MQVYFGSVRQRSREVSGDLVFNDDGNIDQSESWLFDWEKEDPNAYARRAQAVNLTLERLFKGERF